MFAVIPTVNMMYRPIFFSALATMSIWSARGQFAPAVPILLNTQLVDRALAVDLDGDSDEDLLLGRTSPNRLVWLENDGLGSFGAEVVLRSGLGADMPFDVSDLDDDGDPDVLFFDAADTTIYWRANDGTGGFGVEHLLALVPNTYTVFTLRAGDLTADGLADVACTIDGGIRYWINSGTGFGSSDTLQFPGGPVPKVLGMVDMNADGDVDLTTANWSGFITLGENSDGVGGSWTTQTSYSPGMMSTSQNFAFIDADGDGDTDMIDAAHQRRWLRNEAIGTGTWPSFSEALVDGGGPFHTAGVVAEFGCGGGIDFIYSTIPANEPVFWASMDTASGEFGSPQPLSMLPKSNYMTSGDLNGDGLEDVLALHGDTLSWFANTLPQAVVQPTTPALDTLCANGGQYVLPEGVPAGGVWSGPNTAANTFNASVASAGTYSLFYTATDTAGCSASATAELHVVSQPSITPAAVPGCPVDSVIHFSAAPAGGVWGGGAEPSGILDVSCSARPIMGAVTYQYTDATGQVCFGNSPSLSVQACAPVQFDDYGPYCSNSGFQLVTATGPPSGFVFLAGDIDSIQSVAPFFLNGWFDPSQGAGLYTITASALGPNYCPSSRTDTVEVLQAPYAALELPSDTIFECGTAWSMYGGSPAGGLYYVDSIGIPEATFDHVEEGLGPHVFYYQVTDLNNGCTTIVSDAILVDCITAAGHLSVPAFALTPNPTSGTVTFGAAAVGPHDVTVVSALGSVVIRATCLGCTCSLDLNHLEAGCYQVLCDGRRMSLVIEH